MAHDPVKRHPPELPLRVVGSVVLVVLIPVLAAVTLEVFGVGWMVVFFAAFASTGREEQCPRVALVNGGAHFRAPT